MRSNIGKFILASSLILNFSVLITVGYMHYKQSQYRTTPLGFKIEKNRFLFEELSLQPGQVETMKQRALLFHREVDEKRNAIAEKRKKLFALIRADKSETKAIEATINEISSMQKDLQKNIVLHILETKAQLSKEQQKKLFDLIENAMHTSGQTGCMSQATN
jgi:Spy/CpxP family protein refolding chaperone